MQVNEVDFVPETNRIINSLSLRANFVVIKTELLNYFIFILAIHFTD